MREIMNRKLRRKQDRLINKAYKRLNRSLGLKVSRYRNDKTKSGYQMKMEWVLPSKNDSKIFNHLRNCSPKFDKLMTHYSHKIADDLLNDYGDSWLGEEVCPIHLVAVD
jgi:hypothetical protein